MKTDTIHYLTQDELTRLFGVVESKRNQAIFRVAYTYGLRASEIGLLAQDDVDFDRLKIRIRRLKGSISSEYPLTKEAQRDLKRYLRSRADTSPILFPSNQGLPIHWKTLNAMMGKYGGGEARSMDFGDLTPTQQKALTFIFRKISVGEPGPRTSDSAMCSGTQIEQV